MTPPTRQPGGPTGSRPPVVIRDRRRIDPDTFQPRVPLPEVQDAPGPADATTTRSAQELLAERTADLQRLKAEYDNYRRRVLRELEQGRQTAVAQIVASLLPVLDTLDEARARADLAGFEAAAQELSERLGALGLERFATVGDVFDPSRHEAVTATRTGPADCPVLTRILRPGYRLGERMLSPALVEVAQTTASSPPAHGDAEPTDRY